MVSIRNYWVFGLLTSNPEDGLPAIGRAADAEVGARREDVAEGVALLQDARHQSTGRDSEQSVSVAVHLEADYLRALLKSHGDGISVHTAHGQPEQTPHGQELREGPAVDGGNLQDTEDDHVEDHGPLAPPLVTRQPEEGGADGAEEQRQGDGRGDVGLGGVVVVGELLGLDGQRVEVKGIGRPGGQADEEEGPALGVELREQAEGVLDGVRVLPLAGGLAEVVGDDDALLPDEEVLEGLPHGRDDPDGEGVRRLPAAGVDCFAHVEGAAAASVLSK